MVAQPCQNPALRHLDGHLDLRFVARLAGPRGQDAHLRVESVPIIPTNRCPSSRGTRTQPRIFDFAARSPPRHR